MAQIHVGYLQIVNVDPAGNIVRKDSSTIAQVMTSSLSIRVIPDLTIPNSAGHPTVKTYLEMEAADDFLFAHIDQNMIITQKL
ncbi:MAG: hypothetical protein Q8K86_08980 [Candidatus Nanopelagicaceae bacterium]|nr:hypothetical protein [Candidatus Nanopelagicaceae bacterium]